MKHLFILLFTVCLFSCNSNVKKETIVTESLSTVEKIANAHGYENWNTVKTFGFTFGGKYDEPDSGRSWIWNPKTNDVTVTRDGETTAYNRNSMDSIAIKTDRAFINDKFWALIPFQLVWDEGTTISEPIKEVAPIHKKELNKITVLYADKGGYTPGDAYDIYYNDDFIIQEWAFRKGNAPEVSLSNTFENYKEFSGLKIAQEHKKGEGDWNLLVWNVNVKKN
jgi:hypothetical protein